MANTQDSRAQFEKWCARKWGVVSSFVKGRYLDLDDQDRWEAYAAGSADENEACLQVARAESESADTSEAVNTAIRIVVAIRARQEQERGKP